MNNEDIKLMDIPINPKWYDEDITKHTPDFLYGKQMKDYITNSIYNDWCRWYFPNGIKNKIKDDQLYLVWYTYNDANDPQDSSCQYYVYYIELAPKEIQEAIEMIKKYENKIKKYQHRYEKH